METRLQSSEVRIPKIDKNFEFSTLNPCPYFQSSFARSLSCNTNQSQSLDFELSFRIGNGINRLNQLTSPILEDMTSPSPSPPPPLPKSSPPSSELTTAQPPSNEDDNDTLFLASTSSTPKRRYKSNNANRTNQVRKSFYFKFLVTLKNMWFGFN